MRAYTFPIMNITPVLITQNRKTLKTSTFFESFSFFESVLDISNDLIIGFKRMKWISKSYKGSTMNKVEIKRTIQKSKDVCDANCFI